MTVAAWSRTIWFLAGVHWNATPGGLGRAPALAVVDAPRMDHDHGRPVGPQPVRHLDDAPGVVGEPPGPDLQVGAGSSTRIGASNRATSRTGSTNRG